MKSIAGNHFNGSRSRLAHVPAVAATLALFLGCGTLAMAAQRVKPHAPSRFQAGTVGSPFGAELGALLERARAEGSDSQTLSDRLAAFGTGALPALMDALESRAYHVKLGGSIHVTHSLDGRLFEGVQTAVARHPSASVKAELERRIARASSLEEKGRVLALMGAVLPGDELPLLGSVLTDVSRRDVRSLGTPFAEAATVILDRDPAADAQIGALYRAMHPSLIVPLLKVLHDLGGARGAAALSSLLSLEPEADPLVLIELADLGRTVSEPLVRRVLEPIRRSLERVPPDSQVEAVKALGRFDDVDAIPLLITRLSSGHAPLADAARRSLEILSRERFGTSPDAWKAWYQAAERWRVAEAPGLLAEVRGADVQRARRALLVVARYRVFRHSLMEGVASALSSPDPTVVELGCTVLGHFATSDSIPSLVDVLGSNRPEKVRKAAFDALVRATGQNHGENAADWKAAGWSKLLERITLNVSLREREEFSRTGGIFVRRCARDINTAWES